MSDLQNIEQTSWGYSETSQIQRNRVMRNTYALLALSLLPTVLGAWLGVATGITQSLGGGLGLIVFIGGAIGFMYAIEKNQKLSSWRAGAAGLYILHGLDALAHDCHDFGL